ncbi:isochorismatase family protein [Methanosarcina acetivorans]|uniref:isochorismatase family protein n=1 Tax=Methanosarcina acetivorans TaxID=2214 RepID=UPI00064E772D|nr:isochorismatase family protein [Methanosarcina acetivorans]
MEELSLRPEDFIVIKCNAINGFSDTALDKVLKRLKRNTLILAEAFDRGYNIIVLSNCTASINAKLQGFSIEAIFPMLGGSQYSR